MGSLQILPEETRYFILDQLAGDKVRIFGYEKVSGYLSYENQIKLLLAGLLGTKKFKPNGSPICLNFLALCEKIEKRYEAVNDYLNTLFTDRLLGDDRQLSHFFSAETGIILIKEEFPNVCSIDFQDSINISQKISCMAAINNMEQLKDYFHATLQSIRTHPFYPDDYVEQFERSYEKKMIEIRDMILDQTKTQMDLVQDYKEVHDLVRDLLERSKDIGFSEDQKHRLNDLYELRKDRLRRERLSEIESVLETIHDAPQLRDYWDRIKWYLRNNRRYLGKEFESIIARKFDAAGSRIKGWDKP